MRGVFAFYRSRLEMIASMELVLHEATPHFRLFSCSQLFSYREYYGLIICLSLFLLSLV